MGLLDTVYSLGRNSEEKEKAENIGKVASDKAVDLVKQLSGVDGDMVTRHKVIDNVILMTNAQGGTGASTITANVAFAMANRGLKVIVIDLNIMFPIQQTFFEVQQEIEKPDLVSYLEGLNPLGNSIETAGKVSIMYANNKNLMDALNCEDDLAIANFTDMITTLKSLYDVVLIDCPMNINHTLCNTAMYICNSIYIVWDEGLPSINNTDRIRRNLALTGIESYTKMRVILNKRTDIHYTKYPFEKFNMELCGVLPFDQDIIESSLRGQVFIDKGITKSKNAKQFALKIDELALTILKIGGYTSGH